MKKTFSFKLLALLLTLSLGCVNGFAAALQDAEIFNTTQKFKFQIKSIDKYANTGTCIITANNLDAATTTTLTVPETFAWNVSGTYAGTDYSAEVTWTVIGIGDEAFAGLYNLTTVSVPASVKTIGVRAFYNCGKISSFTIANSSDLETIGNFAFGNTGIQEIDLSGCSKLDLSGTKTPFTASLTDINYQLKKVTLPAELESVGTAFKNCATLEEVNLEDTRAYIVDANAFSGCAKLKKITIPADKVGPTYETTTIGANAFNGCTALDSVAVQGPLGANAIDATAFTGANHIKHLVFNGDLTGAAAIADATFDASKATLLDILFKGDITAAGAIAAGAFLPATGTYSVLNKVQFDGDITAAGIGQNAFKNAPKLATIFFNGDLAAADAVGQNAFSGAGSDVTAMTITFNGDITAAGAIHGTNAGEGAFYQTGRNVVGATTVVNFNGDLAIAGAIPANAFEECRVTTLNVQKISAAAAITAAAFDDATRLATVNFYDLLVTGAIPANQFDATNTGLATLNFKNDFVADQTIAANAFAGLTGLLAVNIEGNITAAHSFGATGKLFENAGNITGSNNGFVLTISGDLLAADAIYYYNFTSSYVKKIVITGKVVENAFRAASVNATTYLTKITYLPENADAVRLFNLETFNNAAVTPDIVLTTTEKVKYLYVEETGADITPYRIKFQVVSYITPLVKDKNSNNYYNKFAPKAEQYIIPRYQDNDAVVTVYSAYYDKNRFTAPDDDSDGQLDLYMNPLRLQTVEGVDGTNVSAYVINANECVIIRSTKNQQVQMFEDANGYDGGIQTIGTMTAHQANDLRYSQQLVNEWGIQNNYTDSYGNVLKNYAIWTWLNPATQGFSFGLAKDLYKGDVYVLGSRTLTPAARINVIWTDGDGSDNQTTAILSKLAETQPTQEGIFTLHGVRVSNPVKGGVYIKNGKKVIIK